MAAFAVVIALQFSFGLSAYRYATISSGMLYFLYAALAFLASQSLQRTVTLKILACILTLYGAGVAAFATVQGLSSNGKLYWVRTPKAGGWIYGPYVSHNHYAGLMEMLFPIALVIALSSHVRGHWRWIPAVAGVLMAGTIFLSGSRGGMIAFVGQMVVMGIVLRIEKNHRSLYLTAVILVLIAALMLWVGGEAVVTRIASIHSGAQNELDAGVRLNINKDGFRMFARKPILGWGLGTFSTVYPEFRTFYTNKFVNRAHNDYLQLLVETGLVGFGIGMWFVCLLYRTALKKLRNWHSDLNSTVALAAMLGCTGILIHGFLDSNLQIPANAALFYVLATVASSRTNFGSHRRLHHHRRHRQLEEQPAAL
jgi:O-antigen ligase